MVFSPTSSLRSIAATAAAAAQQTLTRQVQITTSPRPRNIAESRLILTALQKFGGVVTFRHLRGNVDDPEATSLVIFETPESAARAIEASPLTVPIPKHIDRPKPPNEHVLAADPLSKYESIEPPRPFTCKIQESHHDHGAAMKENPSHGPFQIDTNTYQYHDLVNSGIPQPELADCFWEPKRPVTPSFKKHIYQRNKMNGATSLMRIYREGFNMEKKKHKEKEQKPLDTHGQELAAKRNDIPKE